MTENTQHKTCLRTVYSFFGPPGAGKGTVAREAARRLGFKMVSTGDLLRAEVESASPLGKSIREIIARGGLVSDNIVTEVVFNVLHAASTEVIILDGYPRTRGQASVFAHELSKTFPNVEFKVVHFDLSYSEIRRRIAARLTCEKKACQATYSEQGQQTIAQGLCDWCGSRLIRRQDDTETIVDGRLVEYDQHAQNLIEFYHQSGIEICRLDPLGKSEEAVFQLFVTQCAT